MAGCRRKANTKVDKKDGTDIDEYFASILAAASKIFKFDGSKIKAVAACWPYCAHLSVAKICRSTK